MLRRLGLNTRAIRRSFKNASRLDGTSGICGFPVGGRVEANYVYMHPVYLPRNPSELFKNDFASSAVEEECILLFVVKKNASQDLEIYFCAVLFSKFHYHEGGLEEPKFSKSVILILKKTP
jgi:hypothetical protein